MARTVTCDGDEKHKGPFYGLSARLREVGKGHKARDEWNAVGHYCTDCLKGGVLVEIEFLEGTRFAMTPGGRTRRKAS